MRVLWFTNTSSNFKIEKEGYNGGGWISSLESELTKRSDIELGICFITNKQEEIIIGNTTYYLIDNCISKINKWIRYFIPSQNDEYLLHKLQQVIEKFKPDVINVFGTEFCYGKLSTMTSVPLIIHIQGFINPCLNAFLIPGQSLFEFLYANKSLLTILKRRLSYYGFYVNSAKRELEILKSCKHFIGRTEWDKNIVMLYAHKASYYYGSEILRPIFYKTEGRKSIPTKLTICSTISGVPYKGFDVVLKCARLLKDELNLDFDWFIFGNIDEKDNEHRLNIKCSDYNVHIKGVASSDELVSFITKSTCFVHPSYIDNSPNSICEAQMLACPVIAQYVGGVPSLIENGINGILLPANDPYQMAICIKKLHDDKEFNIQLGINSRFTAMKRHNKEIIIENLLRIYREIVNLSVSTQIRAKI